MTAEQLRILSKWAKHNVRYLDEDCDSSYVNGKGTSVKIVFGDSQHVNSTGAHDSAIPSSNSTF